MLILKTIDVLLVLVDFVLVCITIGKILFQAIARLPQVSMFILKINEILLVFIDCVLISIAIAKVFGFLATLALDIGGCNKG